MTNTKRTRTRPQSRRRLAPTGYAVTVSRCVTRELFSIDPETWEYQNDRGGFQVRHIPNGQVAVSGPLRLLDDVSASDRLRHGIGRISVLMGWCEEPSNVKADGMACPMRHRCFGCVHFRTDPSFLVDLRHYLATLLADKERLAATVPGLAEWARSEAMPSDGEIAVVRRLITDCEARLVGLDPVEHSEVLEAMDLLARTRTALDDIFPLFERGQVSQSVPVAFPRVAAGR